MALNRFSASVVSRGKGHNVIARAAYNARTCLRDDRTGDLKDYRSKGGLEFEGIFTPKDAPEWARDRESLWNEVEKREDLNQRRDTAQLARDFKICLPHELTAEQRRWMVTDFAREMARRGMVVDVAIHAPDRTSDERNYHVHMLVTMRELGPDGFKNKVREWNQTAELEKQRERWSELGARALKRAGFDVEAERFREGHKTLREQRVAALQRGDTEWARQVDREPTRHLGPQASAMERREVRTVNGDHNRDIESRNFERALVKGLTQVKDSMRVPPMAARAVTKIAEFGMDAIGDMVDSLFSPKQTPERKRQADDALLQRQIEEQEAARRRELERGRDR
jgi:MobA/MobL family